MNMIKRILSVLMVSVLLFTVAPLSGFADIGLFSFGASAFETTGQCGDNAYWSFDVESGEFSISGTGDIWDYTVYEEKYFFCQGVGSAIKSVKINDGITKIGSNTFRYCGNIESVEIADSVSVIGAWAFFSCNALEEINVPENLVEIGKRAFDGCKFTSFSIPATVTTMAEDAFLGCGELAEITVDDDNEIFSDTDGVLFDKEQKKIIVYPAKKEGTTYEIPSGVNEICAYAFHNNKYITEIEIPDSVITIGEYAFSNCSELENVIIPDSVSSINESTFFYCSKLKSVTIPNSVKTIGDSAFALSLFVDESALTDVYYLGTQEQWAEIAIADGNTSLLNAEIHFVQDAVTEPTDNETTSATEPSSNPIVIAPATTTTKAPTTTAPVTTTAPTTTEKKAEQEKATKPAKAKIKKPKSAKAKQAVVIWNAVENANGYQIAYSTSKKFTKKATKTKLIKKAKTTKTTLKKLKSGKKYFIKVRAYKTVNGKKVYGAYSKVMTVKIK